MCISNVLALTDSWTAQAIFCLAQLDPDQMGSWLLVVLQVAVGLGMVIFVHELGHFAVAKMCGVKCEKFMIGFDIGGYKVSRKWGETEYGIGILPLGGYVKMLGQDDNPANIAEQVRESQASGAHAGVVTTEITGPDGERYQVDSRSYIAKSVPQRMAIISAGVIMNIIFAFFFAVIAFGMGVPYLPSIVSWTSPGSPAYEAGIRPGDEIIRAGEIKNPSFTELSGEVTLGDMENGVEFVIERDGDERVMQLKPRQLNGGIARIGVAPPSSLRLYKRKPIGIGSPADLAADGSEAAGFQGEDVVIAINGEAVEDYAQYTSILAQHPEKKLTFTVLRGAKRSDGPDSAWVGGEKLEIDVPPNPYRHFGMKMSMGKIAAVQANSPASQLGIHPGDFIEDVTEANDAATADDQSPLKGWDPLTLPELLRRHAAEGREVRLKLRRDSAAVDGRPPTEPLVTPLREVKWLEQARGLNDPTPATALGVAYRVLNRVSSVTAGSPAEQQGLRSDDVVVTAEFVYPESMEKKPETEPIEFQEEGGHNWPFVMNALQSTPPGTQLKLTVKRDRELKTVTLTPEIADGLYDPMRGLIFEPVQRIRIAETFSEQVDRGFNETVRSLGMVYRFLSKLIDGQVPLTALGGPVTIAKAAGYSAFDGPGKLLVFLTMLSANLAVINFLPIPVLDGGHMVFLAYEGIRGRPASERFVLALHAAGFVAIISLMLFVLSLDFGLIERNL